LILIASVVDDISRSRFFYLGFHYGLLKGEGLAEEVGFEPTARTNSSIAVRERPRRAQKAHRESTEIHMNTLSSIGSAVKKSSSHERLWRLL